MFAPVIVFVFALLLTPLICQAGRATSSLPSELVRECEAVASRLKCSERGGLGVSDVIGQALKVGIANCEAQRASKGCDDYYRQAKESEEVRIKCDAASICKHNLWSGADQALEGLKGCGFGFFIEPFKDMAESIGKGWDEIRANARERAEFVARCEKDLACKREFVAGLSSLAKLSDSELSRYDMEQLIVFRATAERGLEAARARGRLSVFQVKPRTPSELDEYLAEGQKEDARSLQDQARALRDGGLEWVRRQGVRLECYDAETAAELACYGAATVFDPTMAVGYGAKLFKARKIAAFAKLEAEAKRAQEAASAATKVEALRKAGSAARSQFVSENLLKHTTKAEQNREWMRFARYRDENPSARTLFIDVENSKLKELNDTLRDKDLVTGLDNLYMNIFDRRMGELKKKYPGKILVYSDYKALRYGFDGEPPRGFDKEIEKIFRATNGEFAERVKRDQLLRATDPDPRTWFKAGIGDTADQASAASRFARDDKELHQLRSYNQVEVRKSLHTSLTRAEDLRKSIERKVGSTEIMSSTSGGKALSLETWEIVRKSKAPDELAHRLNAEFGTTIDVAVAKEILAYAKHVDAFSPALHIDTREVATLEQAVHGGFSADFAGMGAVNMRATETALLRAATPEAAISSARSAERTVTQAFIDNKNDFRDSIGKLLEERSARLHPPERRLTIQTVCSGDDCVSVPSRALDAAEKAEVIRLLATKEKPSGYRISFVPPNAPVEVRTTLATQGETIEKYIRMDLKGKVPRDVLKQVVIGVDMQTTRLGEGRIGLMLGHGPRSDRARVYQEVQRSFEKALDAINADLVRQGKPAAYRTGEVLNP